MSLQRTHRSYDIERKYDISDEEYNVLLEKQNGVCAICQESSDKMFCIDHSHTTGKVRGLLCLKCNTGIGMLNDSIRLLAAAIVYLQDTE